MSHGCALRAMAALIVVGLVVFTAPIIIIPVIAWVSHHL